MARKMNPWAKASAYMGLAFIMPVSMVVCFWIGSKIHPEWGGTAGAILGFAGGLYETYRQAVQIEKK